MISHLVIFFFLFFPNSFNQKNNDDWGANGHRVVAQIAEENLSSVARELINKLLKGKSLVSVSTFADDIKSDPKYRKYNSWHYVNIDSDKNYGELVPNKNGDIIKAIKKCIFILKDKNQSIIEKEFYLKLLIHFIGDIHQPLHVGRLEDRGGNDIKVKWFGKPSNLHRVWDSEIINSHQMSYSELSNDLPILKKNEIDKISNESIMIWVKESQEISKQIYDDAILNSNLGYNYRYKYIDIVKMRLLKGGLRLASILNSIFN